MTFDDIKAALPGLDNKQMRELRALLDSLIKGSNVELRAGRIESTFELALLSAIVETSRPYGGASISQLKSSMGYPAFYDKLEHIEAFFKDGRCDEAQVQWLISFSLNLMVQRAKIEGWLISAIMLMGKAERIPAYLEQAFPGYAKAGLLPMICHHGRGV